MPKGMDFSIKTIDEFIAQYPKDVQEVLKKIRQTIRKAAPEATEKISYGIPTFFLKRNLIHFGAFDKHIGVYPGPSTIEALADELKGYDTSKGTVRFPLSNPIPYDLIEKMTLVSVARNLAKK